MDDDQAERILTSLGIDPATYTADVADPERDADHIYLLRHTLMNPWLLYESNGENYLDLYWKWLESQLVDLVATEDHR